jgi:hypothetical protein
MKVDEPERNPQLFALRNLPARRVAARLEWQNAPDASLRPL